MIIAAADGSALGNPGPAGWAWYVDDNCWAAGGWPRATNNQGELTAVLELLRATAHLDDQLHVLCDSKYVINSITKWMPGWKRKGWRKADGQPVLNRELLEELDFELAGRIVHFEWVKGHNGHELNENADERARAAAEAYQTGNPIPAGPGWHTSQPTDEPNPSAATTDADETLFEIETAFPEWLTVELELTYEEHKRLAERARSQGMSPEELLRSLI